MQSSITPACALNSEVAFLQQRQYPDYCKKTVMGIFAPKSAKESPLFRPQSLDRSISLCLVNLFPPGGV